MKAKLNYKHTLAGCMTGYIVQAVNVNLAPILFVIFQDKFKINLSLLSSIIIINFVTQLIVDMFAGSLTDKIGFRASSVLAMICSALGLACLGVLPTVLSNTYLALVIATIIFSVGGGLIEVVISPMTDLLPLGEKKSIMAVLHSFYCWGQVLVVLLSTIFIKVFGDRYWYVLPFIWAIVPVANIIWLCLVPMVKPIADTQKTPVKSLMKDKRFLLALMIMLCAGACELTISQWSSLFAEKGLGVSKFMGDLLGPCLFAVLMGTGRIVFGALGSKLNLIKIMKISAIACIACYLIMVFIPNPIVSLLACGCTGLTVAMLWPGTISNTSARFPYGGTVMFGLCALAGDLGCAVGPGLAGIVADAIQGSQAMAEFAVSLNLTLEQLALRGGILVGTIFPIMLLLCLFIVGHTDKHLANNKLSQ